MTSTETSLCLSYCWVLESFCFLLHNKCRWSPAWAPNQKADFSYSGSTAGPQRRAATVLSSLSKLWESPCPEATLPQPQPQIASRSFVRGWVSQRTHLAWALRPALCTRLWVGRMHPCSQGMGNVVRESEVTRHLPFNVKGTKVGRVRCCKDLWEGHLAQHRESRVGFLEEVTSYSWRNFRLSRQKDCSGGRGTWVKMEKGENILGKVRCVCKSFKGEKENGSS